MVKIIKKWFGVITSGLFPMSRAVSRDLENSNIEPIDKSNEVKYNDSKL